MEERIADLLYDLRNIMFDAKIGSEVTGFARNELVSQLELAETSLQDARSTVRDNIQ